MSRYINADAAIDVLHSWGCLSLADAEDIVERECPTADVAEVIRCKDCRRSWLEPTKKGDVRLCALIEDAVEDSDYCSRGEVSK